jgi:hypothetical protein
MQQTVAFLSLGVNPSHYWRYRAIVGNVRLIPGGRAEIQNMKREISSEEAEFVVAYCGATAFEIEDRVGSLRSPFGRSRW